MDERASVEAALCDELQRQPLNKERIRHLLEKLLALLSGTDGSSALSEPGSLSNREPLTEALAELVSILPSEEAGWLDLLSQCRTDPGSGLYGHAAGRTPRCSLLYAHRVFGIFMDAFNGCPWTIFNEDGAHMELDAQGRVVTCLADTEPIAGLTALEEQDIQHLCQVMLPGHGLEDEKAMREYVADSLQAICGGKVAFQEVVINSVGGEHTTVLASMAPDTQGLNILVKRVSERQLSDGSGYFRGACSCAQLLTQRMTEKHGTPGRCCAIIFAIAGSSISVGAFSLDNGADFEPLTGFVPLWPFHANHALIQQLTGIFRGLKCATAFMRHSAADAAGANPLVTEHMLWKGQPVPYSLKGYTIRKHLSDSSEVYLVERDGRLMVAKVTSCYGWQAHQQWHMAGAAPQLFLEHSRNLAGGQSLVMTEYMALQDGWMTTFAAAAHPEEPSIAAALVGTLTRVHAQQPPHAHGDLRDANVLLRWDPEQGAWDVCFLDFQWAAEDGKGRYPPFLNHDDIRWPEGVCGGQPILQRHDHELLTGIDFTNMAQMRKGSRQASAMMVARAPAACLPGAVAQRSMLRAHCSLPRTLII
ncbi:hypothetical protein WJX73_001016 [Symbiochloris irregularis]|uniref:Protein kinase domain-containing protein n=1 Tax=Symbiochloris irregularis TaxID=706552 RepID=A0AAW1PMM6_9CHLO